MRYSRPLAGTRTSSTQPSGSSGEPSAFVARTRFAGGDGACWRLLLLGAGRFTGRTYSGSGSGSGGFSTRSRIVYLMIGSPMAHIARGRFACGVAGEFHICSTTSWQTPLLGGAASAPIGAGVVGTGNSVCAGIERGATG